MITPSKLKETHNICLTIWNWKRLVKLSAAPTSDDQTSLEAQWVVLLYLWELSGESLCPAEATSSPATQACFGLHTGGGGSVYLKASGKDPGSWNTYYTYHVSQVD